MPAPNSGAGLFNFPHFFTYEHIRLRFRDLAIFSTFAYEHIVSLE